ncbi:MAG: TMEM165/GDT1 family protein [Alphaproteobacteria bacterium]|nr:MAG: TMEM165/GDT1 family protein [Alphaproteobacteria bacterium]
MDALLISLGIVALAELGDKTQILVLLLAARFRQPVAIIAGLVLATIVSHLIAAIIGRWIADLVDPVILAWGVGCGFIAMGVWALLPEKVDAESEVGQGHGAFLTTLIVFSIAEIGDKTQIAVAALAARFDMILTVVAGTTLGMIAANLPAVFFGHAFAKVIPMKAIRIVAAIAFSGLGVWAIIEGGAAFKSS